MVLDGEAQLIAGLDGLAVDLCDDVALLEAGLVGAEVPERTSAMRAPPPSASSTLTPRYACSTLPSAISCCAMLRTVSTGIA